MTVRSASAGEDTGRKSPVAPRIATLRELRRTLKDVQQRARQQRERAISLRERMMAAFREALALQAVATIALDDLARHIAVNDTTCVLTGYSEIELLQMKPWNLTSAGAEHQPARDWQHFLHHGRFEGTCRLARKTGDLVLVRYTAAANVMPGVHVAAMAPRRGSLR